MKPCFTVGAYLEIVLKTLIKFEENCYIKFQYFKGYKLCSKTVGRNNINQI